jgi:hypothetical protein
MSQGQGFSMDKLSSAEKLIAGSAIVFIIWVFIPVWYSCCSALGVTADLGNVNGFRGVLIISWLLAIVAVAEIVAHTMGTDMNLPMKRGQIHLIVAGIALVFTLLGLVAKSTGLTLSWGIFVGLLLTIVWAYGAYMMYNAPESATGDTMGGMAPPPPPGPAA